MVLIVLSSGTWIEKLLESFLRVIWKSGTWNGVALGVGI
jgi:hypothetical protein